MTFKNAENKAVLRRLVREVNGLCPEFLPQHIHCTTQYKELNIILLIVYMIQSELIFAPVSIMHFLNHPIDAAYRVFLFFFLSQVLYICICIYKGHKNSNVLMNVCPKATCKRKISNRGG